MLLSNNGWGTGLHPKIYFQIVSDTYIVILTSLQMHFSLALSLFLTDDLFWFLFLLSHLFNIILHSSDKFSQANEYCHFIAKCYREKNCFFTFKNYFYLHINRKYSTSNQLMANIINDIRNLLKE